MRDVKHFYQWGKFYILFEELDWRWWEFGIGINFGSGKEYFIDFSIGPASIEIGYIP